ncbi:RNA polymerase sigma factor SigJ [Micromonospora sp. NPDC049559]|uniref:RNA polymerase sigma factor SigJ n=1 Tax=Micromonospora sp. NPDC049559 TaxID=3155923 RepID=UPI0034278E2F
MTDGGVPVSPVAGATGPGPGAPVPPAGSGPGSGPGSVDPDSTAARELLAHRPMLLGLAYRLLGSRHDAEDVLQEAYLRWLGTDRGRVDEPRRYLSRVVTRLALDRLRARRASRETYPGTWLPEPVPTAGDPFGPLDSAERRDTLSLAMLHLLERLSPPERAVYVLHTAFELPYTEIAEILDRSPEDCRQLQHRARAHLARDRPRFPADPRERRRLLDGFLAAARDGDLPGLARLVRADATAWSDGGGRVRAALNPVHGAEKISRFFVGIYRKLGRTRRADAPVRGPAALRVTPVEFNAARGLLVGHGHLSYALTVEVTDGMIGSVYLVSNPEKLVWLTGRTADQLGRPG